MIVKIIPLWEGDGVRGFKVVVAGEVFEVRQVFVNDKLERDPSYDVRFVDAIDVSVNGEDEVLIYTEGLCDE